MDPTACLERIQKALESGTMQEAREAAEDLAGWLRGGGFEPEWTRFAAAGYWFSNRYSW